MFPHQYTASATTGPDQDVTLDVEGLESIPSCPPKVFGGAGDKWSPEDLLIAAVADCFVLSFKAIATASKFQWNDLHCQVIGTLDKVDRLIQFTEINIHATIKLPTDGSTDRAKRLLEKAEQTCLITNSLKPTPHLTIDIQN